MPKLIRSGPKPPSTTTLRKYGMTEADWYTFARLQNYTCPICQRPFEDRALVIDHEHVKGWRARKPKKMAGGKIRHRNDNRSRVMTPEERRPHVRGILHSWCNLYVRSWLTLPRAESIVAYLRAHESRRQSRKSA